MLVGFVYIPVTLILCATVGKVTYLSFKKNRDVVDMIDDTGELIIVRIYAFVPIWHRYSLSSISHAELNPTINLSTHKKEVFGTCLMFAKPSKQYVSLSLIFPDIGVDEFTLRSYINNFLGYIAPVEGDSSDDDVIDEARSLLNDVNLDFGLSTRGSNVDSAYMPPLLSSQTEKVA